MKKATFHEAMRAKPKKPTHSPPLSSPPPVPAPTAFTIKLSFDASCDAAPVGFKTVVAQVASDLMKQFSNPVIVNINVGFGEFAGMPLGASAIGESDFNYQLVSYPALIAALKGKTSTTFLPPSDPSVGNQWFVTNAQAKALGLLSATAAGVDAYVGFSSTATFDFNNTDGVNGFDLYGTCFHELSECLGRVLPMGVGFSSAYNLMCYSVPGILSFDGAAFRYFSIDGGKTPLNTFNSNPGGDFGDWRGDTVDAANAFGSAGVVMPVSGADLVALGAIGWTKV
jgi:hypothetical protein